MCWEGQSCSRSQDIAVHPLASVGFLRGWTRLERNNQKCFSVRRVPTAAYREHSSATEQGAGPPASALTPQHRDQQGPQPGRWVPPAQFTQSQADLGRDPLKRPRSSLIALGRLSPVPRAGTERAGTVLGPWEPLPEPQPCSRPRGKARGTEPRSPQLCHCRL